MYRRLLCRGHSSELQRIGRVLMNDHWIQTLEQLQQLDQSGCTITPHPRAAEWTVCSNMGSDGAAIRGVR